jgi:Flp pilus assembly protein TadG
MKPFSNKRGGVLVVFAVALIVMAAMAGLAVDVAHLYGVKSQLQVAADAAALAGANALTGSTPAASATTEATTVGAANYADADSSGNQVKVALHAGDISTGNWDGTTFALNGNPLNAVRVVARRTGPAGSDQPMVQNWLIKVLSILPGTANFSKTGVTAMAIACRTKLNLVPVAVNEYWNNSYPNSYMRATNIDPGHTPGRAGTTFAFLGGAANRNCGGGNDTNGWACLTYRCDQYDGKGTSYGQVNASGHGNCSDCPIPTGSFSGNSINNEKNTYKGYLNNGIPDGVVPPLAVPEPYNANYNSCNDQKQQKAYKDSGSFNSQCPYATVPHFAVSGNISGVNWTVGRQLLVMVYDGYTEKGNGGSNGPSFVTVVGYGIIQVDSLGPPTWTGHAIKHGIKGQADPYLIQPSTSSCSDLMTMLEEVQQKFPAAKLVGSNDSVMHYGMATH